MIVKEYIVRQAYTDDMKYALLSGDKPQELVRCKDCRKHNHSMTEPPYYARADACPLVAYRGKAQGHEFDYQYCVCGERKE